MGPGSPEQPALWGSWVELGEAFHEAIVAAPVPVDLRALRPEEIAAGPRPLRLGDLQDVSPSTAPARRASLCPGGRCKSSLAATTRTPALQGRRQARHPQGAVVFPGFRVDELTTRMAAG